MLVLNVVCDTYMPYGLTDEVIERTVTMCYSPIVRWNNTAKRKKCIQLSVTKGCARDVSLQRFTDSDERYL